MSGAQENENIAPHAGVVVRVSGGQATVRFVRGKMCEHCGACISVGDKELEMTVPTGLNASVGDLVEVSLAPKRIVQASLLAYAIPLALLLSGVGLGSLRSDLTALLGGVAGCAAGYFVLRILERRGKMRARFQPQMTAVLPSEGTPEHEESI